MVKFKLFRISLKKAGFVFLTFYIIFIFYNYHDKLYLNKNEDCSIQSIKIIKTEQKFRETVNSHLKVFFKDVDLKSSIKSEKWASMATNIYGYSAFLEECPSFIPHRHCVKFITIVSSNLSSSSPFKSSLECAVKNDSFIYKEEFATIETLPESHEKLFTAAFLFCPIRESFHPTYASVYYKSLNFTWIYIENYVPKISSHSEFSSLKPAAHISYSPQGISLCVRPLYGDFDFLKFSEFLIYYSLMGIDHFILYYVTSFKPQQMLHKFLKFTNTSHEIYLWDIPLTNDLVHEYGQIVFIQDCFSRSQKRFKHTIIIDIDEYIVPKAHKDIKSLALHLDNENPLGGSYVIPMAMFCSEYSVEVSQIFPYHILNHKKRQKTTWMHKYRSKYIVRPDRIRYGGIHFVWKLWDEYQEVFIQPNVALLNHYKFCCGAVQTWFYHLMEFKVLNDDVVVDNLLFEHRKKLLDHNLLRFLFNLTSESFL